MVLTLIGLGITMFSMAIGTVVWGIRLEGRVNSQKDVADARETFQETLQVAVTQRFDRMDDKIDKVDSKLDRLLERSA